MSKARGSCAGGGGCKCECHRGRWRRHIPFGCKLPHDNPQAITWKGGQDDGCQDEPQAVALGKVGDHAGMITSLRTLDKRRTILDRIIGHETTVPI